ncbi:ATPase, partial [Psychrobacter sp. 1Y4]
QVHTGAMPRHGDVMVYFGNWYADLLYNVMRIATSNTENKKKQSKNQKHIDTNTLPIAKWQAYLQQQLAELKAFEQDLVANQTRLLKCWFHVDMETLHSRLQDSEADPQFLYQIDWNSKKVIEKFNEVAATLLRQQDDWIIIDGDDKSAAADNFCHEVLHAMQMALVSSRTSTTESTEKKPPSKTKKSKLKVEQAPFEPVKIPKSLTNIDDSKISKSEYNDALAKKQTHLAELLRARQGRHVVFAFEGMDAAGKGGAIKRLVAALDPREYQIYNIGAPMLYETQHP